MEMAALLLRVARQSSTSMGCGKRSRQGRVVVSGFLWRLEGRSTSEYASFVRLEGQLYDLIMFLVEREVITTQIPNIRNDLTTQDT